MRRPTLFGGKPAESQATKSMAGDQDKSKQADQETASESPAMEESKVATSRERRASLRYLDRADMAETFADSITKLTFDGQTLRIEFGVTRLDNVGANAPITGRRYPACRLVLPPTAAVDLINRMMQIATRLRQAGVVKTSPEPGEASRSR